MNNTEHGNFEHLTPKEVAVPYFRTSEAMVYEWVRQGVFPPNVVFRIGRKVLFNKSHLEDWIANGGTLQKEII